MITIIIILLTSQHARPPVAPVKSVYYISCYWLCYWSYMFKTCLLYIILLVVCVYFRTVHFVTAAAALPAYFAKQVCVCVCVCVCLLCFISVLRLICFISLFNFLFLFCLICCPCVLSAHEGPCGSLSAAPCNARLLLLLLYVYTYIYIYI